MKQNKTQVIITQGIVDKVLAFREAGNMRPDLKCDGARFLEIFPDPNDSITNWYLQLVTGEVNTLDYVGHDRTDKTLLKEGI